MVNWASGLLGGVQGAASAVVEISDEKRKQLAAQLKQEADKEEWEARQRLLGEQRLKETKQEQIYRTGEAERERTFRAGESLLNREATANENRLTREFKEKELELKKELASINAKSKSSGKDTTKMSSSDMTFVNNIFSQLNGGTLDAEEAQQLIDQQGLPISIKEIPGGKDKRWYLPSILEKDIPASYTPIAKKHEKMSEEDMYMQSLLNRGK